MTHTVRYGLVPQAAQPQRSALGVLRASRQSLTATLDRTFLLRDLRL